MDRKTERKDIREGKHPLRNQRSEGIRRKARGFLKDDKLFVSVPQSKYNNCGRNPHYRKLWFCRTPKICEHDSPWRNIRNCALQNSPAKQIHFARSYAKTRGFIEIGRASCRER